MPIAADIIETKKCPKCKIQLSDIIFYNTEVDYCPNCLGLWFDEEELRWAKDEKDKELIWLDIDLWADEKKFKVGRGMRLCPECRLPLYEVFYGNSKVVVDVCNMCRGIWLDRGEFVKIIEWLREQKNYGIINDYARNLFKQAAEIFTGPETLKEEVLDFLAVVKLLNYKFALSHPMISQIISNLPR